MVCNCARKYIKTSGEIENKPQPIATVSQVSSAAGAGGDFRNGSPLPTKTRVFKTNCEVFCSYSLEKGRCRRTSVSVAFVRIVVACSLSPLPGFSEALEDGGDAFDQAVTLPDHAVAVKDKNVRLAERTYQARAGKERTCLGNEARVAAENVTMY